MEGRTGDVALRGAEVPMIEQEVVRHMRELQQLGWGSKRIARELGVSRNAVRRYLRGAPAGVQQRRSRWALDEQERARAVELMRGEADGNAVVVHRLLGVEASVRSVQRAVEAAREAKRAAEVATVRFETAPGHQMQVDFGERRVRIAGQLVRVFLLVAVLSFSRRIFVRAFLSQRQDDWREGLVGAFEHFGGLPRGLLLDNAGALVVGRDRATGTARLHPAFEQFRRDWDLEVRVCQPYRARTKGKIESGIRYVKRNAIARMEFVSFAALQSHLEQWASLADERVHGTTHELPRERFEREERAALRPLPSRPMPVRERRLSRRVATDCFVDVDTVRYSVPHRLVRQRVEVLVQEQTVLVFSGAELVAEHRRSEEPYSQVLDPAHHDGLWRRPVDVVAPEPVLEPLGRSLADYAAIVGGDR